MITTYNFDDMQDTEWLKVIGKPVMLGFYRRADDSVIAQLAGNLLAVSLTTEKVKITTGGDGNGWYDPNVAYGLISFWESD